MAKTAGKVATDEHTWELFVEEQGIEVESYPSEDTVVEFAVSTLRDELQHVCVLSGRLCGARSACCR